ncbi:NADAR family protein [Streptomyces spongiicola]|nr:NADAR family protein [Streptomyces spongiicola]
MGMTDVPVERLAERISRGGRVAYLHFRGHRPASGGAVGAGCLSQWWPAPLTVDGIEYATAEHRMMARKARLFGDGKAEARAVAAAGPAQAKKAGRLVRGFSDATWERERFGIVVEGNAHKSSQHPEEASFLLVTGGRVLVEASPTDRIWGIGLAAGDERAHDPARRRGPNLLGLALMEVRERLRAGRTE